MTDWKMRFAHIQEKFDEWVNPIVVKEMRQAVRSKFITRLIMLFLLVQIIVLAFYLIANDARHSSNFYLGRELFTLFMAVLMFAGIMCLPAYVAVRLNTERSGNSSDLLFITTLSPRRIISGKFFGTMLVALLLYSCCMPFITFTYLLRGVDLSAIFVSLGFGMLMIALSIQGAIFFGSLPAQKNIKSLVALGVAGGLFALLAITIAFSDEIVRRGIDTRDFWQVTSTALILTAIGTGFFYVLSVMVITAPSANRTLPIRIFTLIAWGSGLSLALFWHIKSGWKDDDPIIGWAICATMLCSAGMLMAISERETPGLRVRRQIPESSLARLSVFPLYSGAGGGMIFYAVLTVLSFFIAFSIDPDIGDEEEFIGNIGFFLSTINYGLIAIFIRRSFFATKIRHIHNWVLALLLSAMGMLLPFLLVYLFSVNSYSYNIEDNVLVWLGNPFTAYNRHYGFNDIITVYFIFNIVVLAGGILININWLKKQYKEFQAYRPKSKRELDEQDISRLPE